MIHPERVRRLNDRAEDGGRFVLYWMQQSQRAAFNHALEYAVSLANARGQPVIAGFGLTDAYPEANERHYAFMLEGLSETAVALHARGIKLVVRRGTPDAVALALGREASVIVCDRGYLHHQRAWRRRVAREAACPVVQVEGDAVVPPDAVSDKPEYAARTLRPKILRRLDEFVSGLAETRPSLSSLPLDVRGDVDPRDPEAVLAGLDIDRSVGRLAAPRGGTRAARDRLERFLRNRLAGYAGARGDPARPRGSGLGPYLHFGQISPVEVVRKLRAARAGSADDRAAFLEELVVRRELALNFVRHQPDYDRYRGLPRWARATLAAHRDDPRPHVYTRRELEAARTHDPYWNAAMREMAATGSLPNHMRMYWGKKILEWANTPAHAYRTALALNNRYFLDGRDANSYANVGWLFGLHDRPWAERPVFGTVRYMNAAGLERKFDMEAYLRRVERLIG